jgi:hypothetical protein
MSQITYENGAAIFTFSYPDIISALSNHINEYQVEDDILLLKWLEKNSENGSQDIKIIDGDEKEGIEHLTRIVYIIKDLLSAKRGNIYCKECRRNILPSQIEKRQTSPFDFYKGVDKKVIKEIKRKLGLKGRRSLSGGTGGTTFFCDKDHELFFTRDWLI